MKGEAKDKIRTPNEIPKIKGDLIKGRKIEG